MKENQVEQKEASDYPMSRRRSFKQERQLTLQQKMTQRMTPVIIDVWERTAQKSRKHWVFLLVVMLPTFIMACYLWIFASPQYISEAHFVVKGKTSMGGGGLSSLLQGSMKTTEDAYAVQDYMKSRDALHFLQKEIDIKVIYHRPYANYLAAFPSIFTRHDFESFYKYYQAHVKAEIDQETGISHLTVRTFSPQDSQLVATKLLEAGEKLVNEMNVRQRHDRIYAAQKEVAATQKELHQAELTLAEYRHGNEILDPVGQSKPITKQEFELENQLSKIVAEKVQLDLFAPNSPLRSVYQQKINSIKAQIKESQEHMTGTDKRSFIPKLLGYDELMVQQQLIQKKLIAEMTSLEVAKQEADRQMLFITIVTQPNCPDYAKYPRVTIDIVITFVATMFFYVIANLLISGAKEHAIQ